MSVMVGAKLNGYPVPRNVPPHDPVYQNHFEPLVSVPPAVYKESAVPEQIVE